MILSVVTLFHVAAVLESEVQVDFFAVRTLESEMFCIVLYTSRRKVNAKPEK